MSKLFKDKTTMGVIVSRMQVPYLTESHKNMIDTVQNRHNRMLILLGVSDKINEKNPYPFEFRRQMLIPLLRDNDIIIPLKDQTDNKEWVRMVDLMISSVLNKGEEAVIYGGRDSFIPHYTKDKGLYQCVELLPEDNDSGTELRTLASIKIPKYSPEVAEALIYYYTLLKNENQTT